MREGGGRRAVHGEEQPRLKEGRKLLTPSSRALVQGAYKTPRPTPTPNGQNKYSESGHLLMFASTSLYLPDIGL